MASSKANEFLIKQLSINKEIVTFRWLSRALSIHVNVAKNELALFYASSKATDLSVHATYLLTGDVAAIETDNEVLEDDMDVDERHSEVIPTRKIMLVSENDLETAKGHFTHIPSIHVYSLSPAAINDAALLSAIADRVRSIDVSKGEAYNQSIGIVVSSDVKTGYVGKTKPASKPITTTQPAASSSKATSAVASKALDLKANFPEKRKPEEKKRAGTLDWGKAKSKTDKEREAESSKKAEEIGWLASKAKDKEEKTETSKASVKTEPDRAKSTSKKSTQADKKQGTKRPSGPSAVMSISDLDDKPSPRTKRRVSTPPLPPKREQGIKVKRGVLLSDDSDKEESVKKAKLSKKGKGRAFVSDDEDVDSGLRAMMDLDDTQISRTTNREPISEPVSDQDDDVEMLFDDESIPDLPKYKRKPKKVILVGKNGLPKKRTVKSRKTKNAKGYMVTEDYSSYESVSESEQPPVQSGSEKKQTKEKPKAKKEDEELSSEKKKTSKEKPEITKPTSLKTTPKPEPKKPQESDNAGSRGTKASNGGKDLMSYFKKK